MDIRIKLSELDLIKRDLNKIQIELSEDLQHQVMRMVDEGEDFLKMTLHIDHHLDLKNNPANVSIPTTMNRWGKVRVVTGGHAGIDISNLPSVSFRRINFNPYTKHQALNGSYIN